MANKRESFNIVVVGLGGQGVLSVAQALADAALRCGWYACRGEERGMSRRGGSVRAVVRIGTTPLAPVIGAAEADMALALEALEAARVLSRLKPHGRLLTHKTVIPPSHPARNRSEAAEAALRVRVAEALRAHEGPRGQFDLRALALEVRCPKALNAVLTGAAAPWLPIDPDVLRETFLALIKPAYRAGNGAAFDLGRRTTLRAEESSASSASAAAVLSAAEGV